MEGLVAILAIFVFLPVLSFLTIVVPIWLILHYRKKNRETTELSDMDRKQIGELFQVANKLDERVATLEAILDMETPGWRQKQAPSSDLSQQSNNQGE